MLKVAAKYFAMFKRYCSAASTFDLCNSLVGEALPVLRLDAKRKCGWSNIPDSGLLRTIEGVRVGDKVGEAEGEAEGVALNERLGMMMDAKSKSGWWLW
jgi:hypothetical protein